MNVARIAVAPLFALGVWVTLVSMSEARELPPRAISADATCREGQVNGHDGFICRDGNVDYFCTEPRTVCWPIIPPGPYHRGVWRPSTMAQAAIAARPAR